MPFRLSLLVFLSSGILLGCAQNNTSTTPTEDNYQAETGETDISSSRVGESSLPSSTSAQFQEFSPEVMLATADQKRVLFFYANWCPTCRAAEADILQNLDRLPGDLVVLRVNYQDTQTDNEEKALARTYGITYQHTFVQIDSQGNEVTKWNGGQTAKILENVQ